MIKDLTLTPRSKAFQLIEHVRLSSESLLKKVPNDLSRMHEIREGLILPLIHEGQQLVADAKRAREMLLARINETN